MRGAFLLVCFGIPLFLFLVVVALVQIDTRRLRRAARRFPCPRCQKLLGDAGVSTADELWTRHMRTLRERHPNVRFRIVRNLHAVCTQCRARFRFDGELGTFSAVEVTLSFEAEDPRGPSD